MVEYDEQLALETERAYMMPEILKQRARTLEKLDLQAGEKVIDVGCGMGLLSLEMGMAIGPEGLVVGIDNSEAMLALARKRCGPYEHIEFKLDSVERLDEPDDRFDVAACTQLLLYLPDPVAVLREIARVLRPGGRIAVVETDWRAALLSGDDQAFIRRLFDGWEGSIPSPHLPEKLPEMLRTAGFDQVQVEAIPLINTTYLADNYSGGMVTYMLRNELQNGTITDVEADAFRAELEARSKGGRYFFCVNRFLFTAVKGLVDSI